MFHVIPYTVCYSTPIFAPGSKKPPLYYFLYRTRQDAHVLCSQSLEGKHAHTRAHTLGCTHTHTHARTRRINSKWRHIKRNFSLECILKGLSLHSIVVSSIRWAPKHHCVVEITAWSHWFEKQSTAFLALLAPFDPHAWGGMQRGKRNTKQGFITRLGELILWLYRSNMHSCMLSQWSDHADETRRWQLALTSP